MSDELYDLVIGRKDTNANLRERDLWAVQNMLAFAGVSSRRTELATLAEKKEDGKACQVRVQVIGTSFNGNGYNLFKGRLELLGYAVTNMGTYNQRADYDAKQPEMAGASK